MLERLPGPIARLTRRVTSQSAPQPAVGTPSITLILAVYDPPLDVLSTQLDAVANQSSTDWECVVVNDASTDARIVPLLRNWVAVDPSRRRLIDRPINGGIAAATNAGLDAARGDAVSVIDHDDVIHSDGVAALVEHFESHPDDAVVYTDERLVDEDGETISIYEKPDWSPHRHLGQHYLNHLSAARRSVIGDIRVRSNFDSAQDYDFYLRVIESAQRLGLGVGHIRRVLYSWRAIAGSSALASSEKPEAIAAARQASQEALDRRGIPATARTAFYRGEGTPSVLRDWHASNASIALVIVSPDMSIAQLNADIAASTGDVICLVDDPSIHDEHWAAPLADLLIGSGAGAAGPKIATKHNTLLSCGRIVEPRLEDQHTGAPADECGPWGALLVERDVSVLAPLGLTFRREIFEQVGGFPEDLHIDAAVAEFLGSIATTGLSVVWTPGVTMTIDVEKNPTGFFGERIPERRDDVALAERGRAPAIEHFDSIGTARHEPDRRPVFGTARRYLLTRDIGLLTSDVFDTLVTRPVSTPSDLFLRLADTVALPDHVTPAMFALARREAERRARRLRAAERRRAMRTEGADDQTIGSDPITLAPEVSLEEIWSEMPEAWGDSAAMQAAELDLEAEALTPIPETLEIFDLANRRGVPIVLVSDTYLAGTQLRDLLTRAGVDMSLVADVVTSCDHRLGKAHGLLAQVIRQHGLQPSQVVHLGDNVEADVEIAKELGAHPVHFGIDRGDFTVEIVPPALRRWSSVTGTDLGISAAIRATLVDSHSGIDPSFQFGAATMGPPMAGFGRWVSATAASFGAKHVHCMLREGATIAELMRLTAPHGPVPVPLHVSRWVTMRAAVIDGTEQELLVALSRRSALTAEHVADAFDVDIDAVRRVIDADSVRGAGVDDACAALAADDEMRSAIVTGAAAIRSRVVRYMRERLQLDDGPLVVADVGWGGTIQEGLARILRSEGITNEVVGLYLALSAAGEERIGQGARMLSYLPNAHQDPVAAEFSRAISHHADTIEQVMTPAIGTLLDIDETGRPVCRDTSDEPMTASQAASQRGIRCVVSRLADPSLGPTDLTDARWTDDLALRGAFAESIADVVVAPSRRAATALGSWLHDDVAGADRREIADPALAELVKYANLFDVDDLDPHGRRWVSGLAGMSNEALTGQLRAQLHGLDVESLAPYGEGGRALLAAFEVGADVARIQRAGPARVLPGGWSMLYLDGDVDSLRSLRFDAGEITALVDVGLFTLTLETTSHEAGDVRRVDLRDPDLVYVDGHPVDASRFVHRSGGHLLIEFDAGFAATVRHVNAAIGFRSISLDEDSPLVPTPLTTRVNAQRRRVASAVRRRL